MVCGSQTIKQFKFSVCEPQTEELKTYDYSSILGWSFSRYSLFNTCKRKYFYNYYPRKDKDFDFKTISLFKELKSIPLAIGDLSHTIIGKILTRIEDDQTEINIPVLEKRISSQVQYFLDNNNFLETRLDSNVEINFRQLQPKILEVVHNFLNSERFDWLKKAARVSDDSWLVESTGYGETRIDELKAYIKIDFLFKKEGDWFVFDWKSGKEKAAHKFQLIGYAAWVNKSLGFDLKAIKPIISYLHPEYKEITIPISKDDIDSFSLTLKEQTVEMQSFCSDIENNIPLEKSNFPLLDVRAVCSHCNFQELCFGLPSEIEENF